MRVVIVNPVDTLQHEIFNLKVQVFVHFEGLELIDVINIGRSTEKNSDIKIVYFDEKHLPDSITMTKSDFTELRVYVD